MSFNRLQSNGLVLSVKTELKRKDLPFGGTGIVHAIKHNSKGKVVLFCDKQLARGRLLASVTNTQDMYELIPNITCLRCIELLRRIT